MQRLTRYLNRENSLSRAQWIVVVCIPLCLLLCAQSGRAQNVNSSVQGTITDPSGGVVPGASVQLSNVNTGVSRTTQSNTAGRYLFTSLIPGTYTLKVTKKGFATYVHSDFGLRVAERASLDVVLKVGATTQTVTVSAGGLVPLLTPSENSLGDTITPQSIQRLPLNGRNFLSLGFLSGATESTSAGDSTDFIEYQSGHPGNAISITGNAQDATKYYVNGIETVGARMGQASLDLSIADIDQFKIQYGFFMPDLAPAPGVVNVITKSGTNRFHGEAFDFLRNNAWEARNFFSPTPPGPFHRNQFGASLGGPIRKDKMFFFANYEGLRRNQSSFASSYHADSKMFNGDFSELSTPIYNPFTYDPTTHLRQAFAGNIIPPNMINSTSKTLLKYYLPGSSVLQTPTNVFGNPLRSYDYDQFSGRVDTTINSRNTFYAQFTRDNAPVVNYGLDPYSGSTYPENTKLAMAQWTFTPTPTLVNEFRLGYVRSVLYVSGQILPGGTASTGITNTPTNDGLSGVSFTGYGGLGNISGPVGSTDNSYQLQDAVTWSHGNHQVGFGALLNYIRSLQESGNSNSRGQVIFNPFYTTQLTQDAQGNLTPVAGTGDPFADFLLGLPTSANSSGAVPMHDRWTSFQPYVEDSWKIRPSLTANLGFAWYLQTPLSPQGADKNAVHAFDFQTGKVIFAALGQVSPQIYPTKYTNFAPRIGLAWQPGFAKNTVVRAGWGMYYYGHRNVDQALAVIGPLTTLSQAITNSEPSPTYVLGQNVFPSVPYGVVTQQLADNISGLEFALSTNYPTPYVEQWNFDIQHTFKKRYLMELAYLGNEGHHLEERWNGDPCNAPGSIYCDKTTAPYFPITELYYSANAANSNYQALTAKFERQWSNGLSILANYTWSKDLSNSFNHVSGSQSQNPYCRKCDKGMTYWNVPQSLVISTLWNLPIGSGKRFFGNMNPVENAIVGGWGLDFIATYNGGTPFYVSSPDYNGLVTQNQRANRLCNGRSELNNKDLRTNGMMYLATQCFALPAPHYFGDSGFGILTGPGIDTWDVAASKEFPIHESVHLQFRAEAFNAFNHASFGEPHNNRADPNFGRITGTQTAARELQFAAKLIW